MFQSLSRVFFELLLKEKFFNQRFFDLMSLLDDYNDYYHDEIFIEEINPDMPKTWYNTIWNYIDYLFDIIHHSSRITTFVLSVLLIYYSYTYLTRKFPQIKCK